jgi:hypothetical protein
MKKKHVESHVANTKYGMGDYYGTGVKNPIGTPRRDYINDVVSPKKMGKPPKTLA